MNSPAVEMNGVVKTYGGARPFTALRGIDLSIKRGEFIAILGPSGCGKSTLLHLVGCLDTVTRGSVKILGQDVGRLKDSKRAKARREKIGFVFQTFNLLPRLSSEANVRLPMIYAGVETSAQAQRARELLGRVGLGEKSKNTPLQLSGGQRQRVAIARALANNPEILVADEPTGNLDSRSGREIMELFQSLHRDGKTLILVTHDENLAKEADRIVRLKDGQLV